MLKNIRHDINGLKAIAIVFIVLYHFFDLLNSSYLTDITLFNGGFLGVDIFLVVSGFLITASIFRTINENSFSVISFYKRRLLRIFPPLIGVSIFTLAVGYFLLFPDIFKELSIEVLNAFLAIGNFRFANSGGYFSLDSSDKLFLHSWYVCITLQFYILYPLIVLFLNKLFKNNLRSGMLSITVLLSVIAFICSQKGNGYLLTQCRIWEMFLGGVIYLYKNELKLFFRIKDNNQLIFEAAGITLIIFSFLYTKLDNGSWYISSSILTVLATAIVLITDSRKSILNSSIFTYIGKSSYSIYLWHWPIIVFALRLGFTKNLLDYSIISAVIISVSYISYIVLEKKEYSKILIISLSAVILAFTLYVKFNGNIEVYLSKYITRSFQSFNSKPLNKQSEVFIANHLITKYSTKDESPNIFIIGDSHTGHYRDFFIYKEHPPIYVYDLSATMAYGPIFSNFKTKTVSRNIHDRQQFYKLYKDVLNTLSPFNKVVLSNNWYVYYELYLVEKKLTNCERSFLHYIKDLIKDLTEQIDLHKDIDFYIVGQGFYTTKNKVIWSSVDFSKTFLRFFYREDFFDSSRDYLNGYGDLINKYLKEFADQKNNVHFINRNYALKISDNLYKIVDKKTPLFIDYHHYSPYGGIIVGKYIMDEINRLNMDK